MALINQRSVPIDLIDPNPWQTRQAENKEHVADLAKSILANGGLLQVPAGRNMSSDRVQLAFGHSRLAAYKLLCQQGHDEYNEFPVNIRQLDDEQMALAAFTENEKRHDLNPVERARAIQNMIQAFSWTQEQVAEKIQLDRSSVSNSLRMLRMPAEVLIVVEQGTLPVRSAMALMPFYDLTPLELTALEQKYPEALEFVSVARSGQLNSEVIRKTVDEYIKIIYPDPEPLVELPLVVETDQAVVMTEENEVAGTGSIMEETDELVEEAETPESEEELDEGEPIQVPEATKAAEWTTEPAAPVAGPIPAPVPAPVPSREVITAKNETTAPATETTLTVTWNANGGVMIGFRKAGQVVPQIFFRPAMKAIEFTDLLIQLGIE